MFGIASTLDQPTQELLEQQRIYAGFQQLTEDQQAALDDINEKLDRLGFRFFHPDAEYSRYLRIRGAHLRKRFETDDIDALVDNTVSLSRSEREEIATRLISELLEAESSDTEARN